MFLLFQELFYPPLQVSPENASSLELFLVVQHRGSFKRAKLLKQWDPQYDYLQVCGGDTKISAHDDLAIFDQFRSISWGFWDPSPS